MLRNSADFKDDWNRVRNQGVGGSNPLSPTNLSHSVIYAAFARFVFKRVFGTFGTTETEAGSSKPMPYSAAFCLRNAALCFSPMRARRVRASANCSLVSAIRTGRELRSIKVPAQEAN